MNKETLQKRITNRISGLRIAQKQIAGEPCGQPLYCCNNPRHSEYFHLTEQCEVACGLLARLERLSV